MPGKRPHQQNPGSNSYKNHLGLARATARITLANLAYTMRRLVWIEGRGVPA
jgi:hypothetical protein